MLCTKVIKKKEIIVVIFNRCFFLLLYSKYRLLKNTDTECITMFVKERYNRRGKRGGKKVKSSKFENAMKAQDENNAKKSQCSRKPTVAQLCQ